MKSGHVQCPSKQTWKLSYFAQQTCPLSTETGVEFLLGHQKQKKATLESEFLEMRAWSISIQTD